MHDELLRSFSLDGRVAVVTGAASGIGRETSRVLAEAGATPVLCDVNAQGLAETADHVRQAGVEPLVCTLDVSSRSAVEGVADRAARVNGKVDAWINVAGIIVDRPVMEAVEDEVDRMLSVNLKGVYWGCAAAGRVMRPNGAGSIVNFSSSGADNAVPGLSLYSLTKAAVNMLTRTVAKEFGPYGIRANAIAPGWVDTPMGGRSFVDETGAPDPARREEGLRQRRMASPLGALGAPRDIAHAVLYLVADASSFMTGQILRPNGGVTMP